MRMKGICEKKGTGMKKKVYSKISCILLLCIVISMLAGCGGNSSNSGDTSTSGSGGTASQGNGTAGQASTAQTQNVHKDVITFAMCGSDDSYNPYNHNSNYGDIVYDMICDHLVYVTFDGKFEPRLAESWDVSDDYKSITFHLNKNVKWHDGKPFTADDVVFTCQIVTNPEVVSNRRAYFSALEGTDDSGVALVANKIGVEALDDYTVVYRFKRPMDPSAFFSGDNRKHYFLPKHLLENVAPAQFHQSDFFKHPVGTGAFKFESMIPGDRVELVANKDYFLGAPNFDKLVMRTVQASNLVPGLMNGEIDILAGMGLANIPLEDWELAQDIEGVKAVSLPNYGYQLMVVNNQREYLNNPKVRLAMSKAINRQAIVYQLAKGEGEIMYGPMVSSHPYFNEEIRKDPYDPEAAKALLKEAGWDFNREILLMVPTGNKVREYSGPMIQQDLQAIGLKVKIQSSDLTSIIAMLKDDKCDFGLVGSSGSVDPDESRPNYIIDGGQNWGRVSDPKYAELAVKGLTLTSFEERKKVYDEYQKLIAEECPMIYLYSTNSLVAYRDFFDYVPMIDFALQNQKAYAWTFKK